MRFKIETILNYAHVKCWSLKSIKIFQRASLHKLGHSSLQRNFQDGVRSKRDKESCVFRIYQRDSSHRKLPAKRGIKNLYDVAQLSKGRNISVNFVVRF